MNSERLILTCPQCAKKMGVPRRDTELQVNCPHCAHTFQLLRAQALDESSLPPSQAQPPGAAPTPPAADTSTASAPAASHSSGIDVPALLTLGMLAIAVTLGVFAGSAMKPIEDLGQLIGGYLMAALVGFVAALVVVVAMLPVKLLLGALGWRDLGEKFDLLGGGIGIGVALSLMIGLTMAYLASDSAWRSKPYAWLQMRHPAIPQGIIATRDRIDQFFKGDEATPADTSPGKQAKRTAQSDRTSPSTKSGAHPSSRPSPQPPIATAPPAPVPPSDPRTDALMLGLTDAWKAQKFSQVIDYAERLEQLGARMPQPVHYFKAAALVKLDRFGPAKQEIAKYLALGSTARYYEDALRVSLAADDGFRQAQQKLHELLKRMANLMSDRLSVRASWHIDGRDSQGNIRRFDCQISYQGGRIQAAFNEHKELTLRHESGSDSEGGCVVPSDHTERLRVGSIRIEDSPPSYLSIPIRDIEKLDANSKAARCHQRWDTQICPRYVGYGTLTYAGRTYWAFNDSDTLTVVGLLRDFRLLVQQNGPDIYE